MAENYDLIFGQSAGSQYAWSDSDYQNGWSTVGSTPPTAEQFDALQRRSDTKAKDLNDRLSPLETKAEADGRQAATEYEEGDMVTADGLPNGWLLECTTAGTTAAGALTISSPVIGGTVTDGAVVWTINSALLLIGGGALTGTNLTWNGADLGAGAVVAKSLTQTGYIKFASGLIIQWGNNLNTADGYQRIELPISFAKTFQVVMSPSAATTGLNLSCYGYTGTGVGYPRDAFGICTIRSSSTAVASSSNNKWIAIGY